METPTEYELRETVARAIYARRASNFKPGYSWADAMPKTRESFLLDADAAIEAVDTQGMRNEIERLTKEPEVAKQAREAVEAHVVRMREAHRELARMLLRYVTLVPLGHQPHMSAEKAERMANAALADTDTDTDTDAL